MAYGFDDSTVVLPYTTLTKAASNSVGFSNCFSFTNPKYSDNAVSGKAWDEDLALVVEYFDGTTRTKLTKTTEWLISSNTLTLYVKPSSISDASWAAGSFTGKSITLWWRSDAGQDYSGESRLALSPQAIAAQLDKTTRMAVAAIEAANRSIQIHPSNTTAFKDDPKAIPSASAIIPPGVKGGKVLGWDSATEKLTYVVNAALGGFSEATPTTMMQRDISGNSKVAEPTDSAHIATRNYVDNTAIAVNTLRSAADATHAALTTAHGAVSTATASTIVIRDSSSRARVATPSDAQDIANKAYVDNAGGAVASFIVGSTVDNDTTFGKLFADGAVTVPVSGYTSAVDAPGTQGSLVATFNGSSPLAGTYDLKLAKGTVASIKGTGWSVDFTVSPAYLGTVWQIAFPYYMDTAALDNNWQVFVFATASIGGAVVGSVIPLSDQYLHPTTAPTPNQFFATFFPTTAVTYRLILMYTATDTTACNVNLDNVTVSRMTIPNAAAVGGWTAYTPTFSAGLGSGVSSISFQYRRVGDSIDIKGSFVTGIVAASVASFTLPNGLTTTTRDGPFGKWRVNTGTATTTKSGTLYCSVNTNTITFTTDDYGPATSPFVASPSATAIGLTTTTATNVELNVVPIAQWTTNINLATEFTEYAWNSSTSTTTSDTSSFAYGIGGASIQQVTSLLSRRVRFQRPIQITDKIIVEVSPDGIIWTDQANGLSDNVNYSLSPCISATTNVYGIGRWAKVNSTDIDVLFSQYTRPGATWDGTGAAWNATSGALKWRVRKVSNGNMAEQPPVVRAEYQLTSAPSITSTQTLIQFNSRIVDTHSAFSAGVFTAPIAGLYAVSISMLFATKTWVAGQYGEFFIYKQGSAYVSIARPAGASFSDYLLCNGSYQLYLNAGQTISIYGLVGSVQSATTLSNLAAYNMLSISRIGS